MSTEDAENAPPTEPAPAADAGASLEERLAAAEAEAKKLKDDLLRALAEVENTRRRGERATQEARSFAIERFARDLLPVADTFERALAALPEDVLARAEDSVRTFVEGVVLTEKSLIDTFARHGLKRTGAKGDAFDPAKHQAVTQIPSDAPAGAVAEVFQPGYVLADRTVRPAMVAVSLGSAANDKPSGERPAEEPPEGKIDITV